MTIYIFIFSTFISSFQTMNFQTGSVCNSTGKSDALQGAKIDFDFVFQKYF
jgi:hypothetical protein